MAKTKANNQSENKSSITTTTKPETVVLMAREKTANQPAVAFSADGLKVGRGGNIFIGKLNIFVNPVKRRWHRHYHPKNRYWQIHLTVDVVLAAIILGLLAFNFFFLWQKYDFNFIKQVKLEIKIEPTEVTSGRDIAIIINYQNNTKKKLTDTKLAVKLPDDFVVKNVSPEKIFSPTTQTFNLGEMPIGANGQIKINGAHFGAVGQNELATANLNFIPENTTRRLNQASTKTYILANSDFQLTLQLPKAVYHHQSFTGVIDYHNGSAYAIEKITLTPELINNNLVIVSSTIPFQDGHWSIDRLSPQSRGQITFTGRFIGTKDTDKTTTALAWNLNYNQTTFAQKNVSEEIKILNSNLTLTLTSPAETLVAGTENAYRVKIKNQEKFTLKNLVLTLNARGELAPTETSTWDKKNTPALAEIKPGEEKELTFSFKTKTKFQPTTAEQKNLTLVTSIGATYDISENQATTGYSESNELTQKINTNLKLNAAARYFTDEGDQLGIGPIPPIIDAPTKYWIAFNLASDFNDVRDLTITAQLAKNVSWTNNFSVSDEQKIMYNSTNKQISWTPEIVHAPSSFYPTIGADFEVAIIPTADQIGQTAKLVENIKITGTDAFTGQKIEQKISDLTTYLISDRLEHSDGKIRTK